VHSLFRLGNVFGANFSGFAIQIASWDLGARRQSPMM